MRKTNKIIYWVSTVWLSLGMVSTGAVQLLQNENEVSVFVDLGYPRYLLIILGIWKMLGVVVVLLPKNPLLKEWAYAGFFFAMSGATLSHIASGNALTDILPSMQLLVLTIISWYTRPADKKLVVVNV